MNTFRFTATLLCANQMGPAHEIVTYAHMMQDALSDAYQVARNQYSTVLSERVVEYGNIIVLYHAF